MKRIDLLLLPCVLQLFFACTKAYEPVFESDAADGERAVTASATLAVATVKKDAAGVYLQIDDQVAAEVINPEILDFKEDARCMLRYRIVSRTANPPRSLVVYVDWIEAIHTFDLSVVSGEAGYYSGNVKSDTQAPLEIHMDSWMTVLEDGYLTLHYSVMSSGEKAHRFELVQGLNPADPYELHLFHYQNGDSASYLEEGIVAFRLTALPDTKGATVPLTLKYLSLNDSAKGEASVRFDYRTRK